MFIIIIIIIIIIIFLASSFGLKQPSSGQYLQKRKGKMLVHIVHKHIYGIPFTVISSLWMCYL
jgi:hypothetical protein